MIFIDYNLISRTQAIRLGEKTFLLQLIEKFNWTLFITTAYFNTIRIPIELIRFDITRKN
jgi:hypothetical protein